VALECSSRRELASGGQPTRAQDAAVQVLPIRTVFPQHPFRCPQHLQLSTTSRLSVDASDLQGRSNRPVASCGCGGMKAAFNLADSLHLARYRDNAALSCGTAVYAQTVTVGALSRTSPNRCGGTLEVAAPNSGQLAQRSAKVRYRGLT
jgi:hypothetical protein